MEDGLQNETAGRGWVVVGGRKAMCHCFTVTKNNKHPTSTLHSLSDGCFYSGGVSVHGIIYDLYYVIMNTDMEDMDTDYAHIMT